MISAAAMISGHCLAAAKQPGQKTHVQMLLALVRYSQGSNSMSPFKLGGLAVRTHLPPRVEPTFLGGGGVPGQLDGGRGETHDPHWRKNEPKKLSYGIQFMILYITDSYREKGVDPFWSLGEFGPDN